MNERIKQLAEQAGFAFIEDGIYGRVEAQEPIYRG